jgi:regulator-associated protein of mTOR
MFDEISTTCSIAEISLHVHPPPTTHICMLICAHTFMLLPKFNFSHCCRLVYTARPHAPRSEKVVGIGFQPGFDPYKIVSASQAGDIQFLDVRRASEPYLTIEAHRGSLTALAVHRHAPVIASGSAKQMIKVFSLEGEQLTIIRYQPSFMGQRIGSVNCLSFHRYKSLLAAGAGDNALVSIYAEDNYQVR